MKTKDRPKTAGTLCHQNQALKRVHENILCIMAQSKIKERDDDLLQSEESRDEMSAKLQTTNQYLKKEVHRTKSVSLRLVSAERSP
jgi:hypothetical protein